MAGSSVIYFNDGGDGEEINLTKEETTAFLLFVKNNGDQLSVGDSSPQAAELCDAGDRFADLADDEG